MRRDDESVESGGALGAEGFQDELAEAEEQLPLPDEERYVDEDGFPEDELDEPRAGTVPDEDRPLVDDEPESQGEDPVSAVLGEEGQGDLAPEDEQ